jgi:hypothetical protein
MAVKNVCQILSHNYRINCNSSCVLHVHIGNEDEGFSVETVRLFLATIWTLEPEIDELYPKYRRGNNGYFSSFRERSRLAETVSSDKDPAQKGLETLLRGTTLVIDLTADTTIQIATP